MRSSNNGKGPSFVPWVMGILAALIIPSVTGLFQLAKTVVELQVRVENFEKDCGKGRKAAAVKRPEKPPTAWSALGFPWLSAQPQHIEKGK